MPEPKRPLKVFLCHASTDKPKVRELYRYLKKRGIQPWFDEEDLVGGQDWQVEIPKAIAISDAIIICLTKNSVDKEGYIQKEIKFALDKALEMPEGRIFLIPVKFEECEVPFTLSRYQWVDLTIESGYAKMMKALKFRASQLERNTVQLPKNEIDEDKLAIEKVSREREEKDAHEKAEKEAAEKARLKAEEEERQRIAKEKSERETAEKATREQTEKEAAEKARLLAEEKERQKIAKQKADREQKIKETRLKKERETSEKARRGGASAEKVNQVKKDAKPEVPTPNSGNRVVYWIGGFALLVFGVIFLSSLNTPSASPQPTPKNTQSNLSYTSTVTKTIQPSKTPVPTYTLTVTPVPLPVEIVDDNGVTMRLVSAGEFTMGSEKGDRNERPVHKVYLDAFYMDKYEVTNGLYRACVEAGTCTSPQDTGYFTRSYNYIYYYGNLEYDDHPVFYVDWNQANEYCEWRRSTLPTEAQWEKAARGIDERTYPWGEGINCENSNNNHCVGNPTKVGSYESGQSPYGIYDLIGNVHEWVADWYADTYYQESPYENPLGPTSGQYRVARGGSWYLEVYTDNRDVRSANRNSYSPNIFDKTIGFRCAKDATP